MTTVVVTRGPDREMARKKGQGLDGKSTYQPRGCSREFLRWKPLRVYGSRISEVRGGEGKKEGEVMV